MTNRRSSAPRWNVRLCLSALVLSALAGLTAATPHATNASSDTTPRSIAKVRYILRGLNVQPPHKKAGKGKVKDPLFNQYGLSTKTREKASVTFKDGTILNMNQSTNAVLRSPSLTQVKSGEVLQEVVPGTSHSVQTPSAVASAVGTMFDVRIKRKATIVTVVEGSVMVRSKAGSVDVKSGEQTQVQTGKAPSPPQPVDTGAATLWVNSIPAPNPPLGLNIALDANGGNIYDWTSERADPNHAFDAHNANDGRLDRGWQSAAGQVTDQSLWVSFQGLHPYTVYAVFLDCAATSGQAVANAARDFEVSVSDTGPQAGFSPVLDESCSDQDSLQVFQLSAPVQATYVQFRFKNNHGGSDGIAIAELGVISREEPATLGTPTAEPAAATPASTPTDTPTSVPTDTPTPSPTATPTPLPTDTPTPVPTSTPSPTPVNTPTDTPTEVPTDTPTDVPTDTPTDTPTEVPTDTPTDVPTDTPTDVPTDTPTTIPSYTARAQHARVHRLASRSRELPL